MRKFIFSFLALLLLTTTGCRKKQGLRKSERQIRITTGKLEQRLFRQQIPVQGTVLPVEYATLSAKIAGTLECLRVDEGAVRKKGDLLFEIDREVLEEKVAVEESEIEVRKSLLAVAELAVDTAKIHYTQAKQDYDRAVNLHKSHVISQASFEADETAYRKAERAVRTAEASVLHARAQLKEQENALKIARKNLKDAQIQAPFDCTVTAKYVEENEYVTVGKEILRLENLKNLEVVCYISAVYYDRIQTGKTKVEIMLGEKVCGKAVVTYKAPQIDSDSRTFKMKVLLPKECRVVSGMLCGVNLILEERQAYGLPSDAFLLRANNRYIAYTVNGEQRAESVVLQKGITDGSFTEVVNAKEVMDKRFVVTGQTFVNNGSLLKIMDKN